MKDDDKRTLTPRLRFPEFLGDTLHQVQLKEVTAESTTRNGDTLPPTSVMGVTKAEGIVPMEQRIVALNIARYKIVRKDWFAYNPMRLNIGSIARWEGESAILVSPDYVVFKCLNEAGSGIDPAFLDHFRRSDAWEGFVAQGGDGSVRVRIYYKDIGRLPLQLPSIAEQQKIADCLTSLDELIAAQGRKVEALKGHKKGLMQQLFPREGETLPRLRFPEFRDAPAWKTHAFEHFVAKSFYGTSQSTSAKGQYPVLRMGNMVDGALDFSNLVYLDLGRRDFESIRLHDGDILLNRTNSLDLVGKISIFTGELECITASYIVTFRLDKERLRPEFCNAMLNTQLYKARIKLLARPSVSQANINPTTFRKELRVSVPSVAEQHRIADCLSILDVRIAAETDKLAALKSHKRGLMQQLFPSPEAV